MICILNATNSILFLNELSLMTKTRFFTITSFEKDHGLSVMNHHKQHRKLNCIKKDYAVFGGMERCDIFCLPRRNQMINSDVCCCQLNKLNALVNEKRPELVNRKGSIFYHDNATPHMSSATR